MKIWIVVVGEPSPVDGPDVRRLRSGLLSRYMRARGHDVTWFNSTIEHRAKTQRFDETTIRGDVDGTTLVFLWGRTYQGNITLARIQNHRDGAKSFSDIASKLPQPDVIVCSYPTLELAQAVAEYAKARNVPFILDLRDMWPDMIAEAAPKFLRSLAKLAMWPWYLSARKSMRAATGLVGMSRPFLDWGLNYANRDMHKTDRIFHLASDPESVPSASIEAAEKLWDDMGVTKDKIILAFSGMLSIRHDFETLIDGARLLPEALRGKIRIVFCGKGEAEDDLKEKTRDLPHIVFAGWRNLAEIQALFARAKGGLLPYRSTPDFLISFPNKVGEYTGAGLPIITCLTGEVEKLIRSEDCGIMYRERDPASFAHALQAIIEGKTDLYALSIKAKDTYRRHFDAHKIYNDYADYLESLAQ